MIRTESCTGHGGSTHRLHHEYIGVSNWLRCILHGGELGSTGNV